MRCQEETGSTVHHFHCSAFGCPDQEMWRRQRRQGSVLAALQLEERKAVIVLRRRYMGLVHINLELTVSNVGWSFSVTVR